MNTLHTSTFYSFQLHDSVITAATRFFPRSPDLPVPQLNVSPFASLSLAPTQGSLTPVQRTGREKKDERLKRQLLSLGLRQRNYSA